MADIEKYDDEYEFIDPDQGGTDTMEYSPDAPPTSPPVGEQSIFNKTFSGKSVVIRNVLIVITLIIVVMVIYPFIRSSSTIKKIPAQISPIIQESKVKKSIEPINQTPVIASVPDKQLDEKVTQQLSLLQSNQDKIQSEFAATNNQLSGINNNINQMMSTVSELNRMTALYASKVEEQARQIEKLTAEAAAMKKPRIIKHVAHKIRTPGVSYAIQAVIPGRAWLIASNGSTLTVREGSVIAGLGRVSLIDPRQGRVVISSGRVIRFSQEDS